MKRLLLLAGLVAAPAFADDGPRFCPNRPSLEESPCTVEPGRVLAEMSVLDWTRDDQPDSRDDTIVTGDLQLRIGITDTSEVQLNWTAYGHDRLRDRASGQVDAAGGTGDVRLGFRQNLHHPDGKGFSIALEPYVTLPTGGRAIGAGTWGGGLVLPVGLDVSDAVNLQFTGAVSATPDEDRHGRHLAYQGDWGVSFALNDRLDLVTELQVTRDDDPMGHSTQAVAAASLAYQPKKTFQVDVLVGAGLNRDTPDLRIVTGGAVLF